MPPPLNDAAACTFAARVGATTLGRHKREQVAAGEGGTLVLLLLIGLESLVIVQMCKSPTHTHTRT